MTVESFIRENPSCKTDIDLINALFEPFNMLVDEVIKSSQIIRYKLHLPFDVKAQGKVRRAAKDIEFALSSALKSDEIVYGKSQDYVYIDRKADDFQAVRFNDLISKMPQKGLYLLLGKDTDGKLTYTNLSKAPHILVAGTTGSGKSELLHTFIASLIYRRNDNPCELIIVDPKRSEFTPYKKRKGVRVITEVTDAIEELKKCVDMMEERYTLFEQRGCKDIYELNDPTIKPIVVVIDELADLLMQDRTSEQYIARLAQKSRACAIHLILGTQRPSADVITGLIRSNVPTKIALHTSSPIESRIIGIPGAEHLVGMGDMLFLGNGKFSSIRIQSAYLSSSEKQNIASKLPIDTTPVYTVHKQVETATPQKQSFEEYCKENNINWNESMRWLREQEAEEQAAKETNAPKKKRVGLIRGIIALLKVKPIMFRTDDYPPKL